MDKEKRNEHNLDPKSNPKDIGHKPVRLATTGTNLRRQIVKSVQQEKVASKESKTFKYFQNVFVQSFNFGANILQWILSHALYLVLFVFVYNSIKLLKISNPRLIDFATNMISYGWIVIWLVIFFTVFFFHSLFGMFFVNNVNFISVHFSFIFNYKIFNSVSFILSYGLLITTVLTLAANAYSYMVYRQSFGQIVMNRHLVNISDGKWISRKKICLYLFIHLFIAVSFFIWPLFIIIVLLTLGYYTVYKRNWIQDMLKIKICKLTSKEGGLLQRFLELFTFYYRRKAEFVLEEITQTKTKDGAKTQFNSVQKDSQTTIEADAENDKKIGTETLAEEKLITSVAMSKLNVAQKLTTIASKNSNLLAVMNNNQHLTTVNKSVQIEPKEQKTAISACIATFLNFWIYIIVFVVSFASVGFWSALQKARATGAFFKFFLFHISSQWYRVVMNTQVIPRLYTFFDEHGNIVNSMNGWNQSLSFTKNNINYIISFIPHAKSWFDVWNNIEFIVAFLVINFKYSPIATASWLLLFFIAFWFFLNATLIILFGNSFFGLCFSPRKVRLIHASNNLSVSFIERIIYGFFMITFAFLYLVPVVNIVWIVINVASYLRYRESLLNRIVGFKYGIPKQNVRIDILDTVEITNNILLWITRKFKKELLSQDRI